MNGVVVSFELAFLRSDGLQNMGLILLGVDQD